MVSTVLVWCLCTCSGFYCLKVLKSLEALSVIAFSNLLVQTYNVTSYQQTQVSSASSKVDPFSGAKDVEIILDLIVTVSPLTEGF